MNRWSHAAAIVAVVASVLTLLTFARTDAGGGAVHAAEGRETRLRAFAAEYLAPATPAARRAVIAQELVREAGVRPPPGEVAGVVKVLRDGLHAAPRRDAALQLAITLRCAGAFPTAKRWADGPDGARVAELAAACGDADAAEWLVARWRTAEPASDAFRHAAAALAAHVLNARTVDAVGAALVDPARGGSAVAILRPQLGLGGDETAESLAAQWTVVRAAHAVEAREFIDAAGLTLLPPRPRDGDPWRLHGAVPVGPNLRLAAATCIDLPSLGDAVRAGDGAVRIRFRAATPAGAYISLLTDGGAQELRVRCDGKTWFLVEGPPREGDRVTAPCAPGEWAEFVVRTRQAEVAGRPGVYDVRVECGGVEMRPAGGFWRLTAPLTSLTVRAPDAGPAFVGGVTWTSCER